MPPLNCGGYCSATTSRIRPARSLQPYACAHINCECQKKQVFEERYTAVEHTKRRPEVGRAALHIMFTQYTLSASGLDRRKLNSRTSPTTANLRRLTSLHAERMRAMQRLDTHRIFAEESRNRHCTIDDILEHNYTTDLPSTILANIIDSHQTKEDLTNVEELLLDAASEAPCRANDILIVDQGSDCGGSSAASHSSSSETDGECATSECSHDEEICAGDMYGHSMLSFLESGTPLPRGSMDLDDECHFEDYDHLWYEVSPLAARIAQESFEHDGGNPADAVGSAEERNGNTEMFIGAEATIESQIATTCKPDVAHAIMTAPPCSVSTPIPVSSSGKGKEKSTCSSSSDDEYDVSQDLPHSDWDMEAVPGHQVHFLLRRPPRVYFPDSTSDLEQPLDAVTDTPTELHLTAVAYLAPDERISLLKEFLQQNTVRFETFCAQMQSFPATTSSVARDCRIKTVYSSAWDEKEELRLLTSAVARIDALLSPFRADILAEDEDILEPGLQEVCRHLQNVRVPSHSTINPKLTPEESAIVDHYFKQIARIQASNALRKTFLEKTGINVAFFENLLLSAENVRHRRDLGRNYGLKDDLVDGLRRIYSTIACTIPVGLSEAGIERPVQERKEQYEFGPFDPYRLPCRPELFDHESIATTRMSAQGYTGIQVSDQKTPLSSEYWRNMKESMSQVIVAQRQDETGQAKLNKNPMSMNRDFDAFYSPIYEDGMAKYAISAALRIREEQGAEQESTLSEETSGATPREEACVVDMEEVGVKPGDEEHQQRSIQNSPSEASVKLYVGSQMDPRTVRRGRFCLIVNRPEGCADRDTCGYDSHDNEGRLCQSGLECTFGIKCAFVHSLQPNMAPRRPSALRPQGPDLRQRDLRPILNEVLASPGRYKVCTWVNKSKGCKPKTGRSCTYNHTLEGIICEGYQRGDCALGYHDCPLRHVYQESRGSLGGTFSGARPSRAIDQTQNCRNVDSTQHDAQGHHMEIENQQPHPSTFLDQSIVDRGFPSNTHDSPGGLYMQPTGAPSPIYENSTYTLEKGYNETKRKRDADHGPRSNQAAPSNMHEYNDTDEYEMETTRERKSRPDKKLRMMGRMSGHNGRRRERGQGWQKRRGRR